MSDDAPVDALRVKGQRTPGNPSAVHRPGFQEIRTPIGVCSEEDLARTGRS